MQAVPMSQAATGARFWVTRAGYGLLLGAVIAALEFTYYFPLVSERGGIGLHSLVSLLLAWCGEGVILALAVASAQYWVHPRELRAWELVFAVAIGAVASASAWNAFTRFVLRDQIGLQFFVDHVGQPVEWAGGSLYHAWLLLFFGGLAASVHFSRRRHARMLAALRAAELDRAASQQRLAEVTLGSLQARVDPDFLFAALARLERLYEADPAAADRLLDELIVFLRNALSEIRASTTADRTPARDAAFRVN